MRVDSLAAASTEVVLRVVAGSMGAVVEVTGKWVYRFGLEGSFEAKSHVLR
jgi:hypothetical protein